MQVLATIQYKKIHQIGVGQGMNSEVFLVDDPQLGGILAVKEIKKANFGNSIQNYYQEAQAMFASSHANIVPIKYACETLTHICLAMPYFQQGSLAGRIDTAPLPPKEVIRIGQGVLSGVRQIHIKNYIHFDIKPSNVLFSDTNVPMVADFGQTRSIGPNGVTTPPSMYWHGIPPEVYQFGHGVVESDIYQVGLTLYRAVNGDPFFTAQIPSNRFELEQKTTAGKFPNRDAFMPHVPKSLRSVIRKALKVKSNERFASATAFADVLGRVDIHLDWQTSNMPSGEIQWRAKQGADRPDLVVDLLKETGCSTWKVEAYTDRPGIPGTRRAKLELCRKNLTRRQADDHLQNVFQALG